MLDEPTNHLDLEAIEALVEALAAYAGTLVFVSHDRWFVSALATRIVEITPTTGIRDFPGTWDEYLAASGDDHLDASLRAPRAATADAAAGTSVYEEAKRRKSLRASLDKKREKVLGDIERGEARREQIRALWCSDGFYDKTAADEQRRLNEEEAQLTSTIDRLVAEWERIEKELESA
jgi:DNA repair exonuclease SbcCD ATPase subunit